jgi:hypothetical protein
MQNLLEAFLWRGMLITLVVVVTIACTVLVRALGNWLRARGTSRPDIADVLPTKPEPSYLSATDRPRIRRELPRSADWRDSTQNAKSREAA